MAEGPKSNRVTRLFLPVFWIFGLIIFGISIAGIATSQYVFNQHHFIVVLVFITFMGILSVIQYCIQKKSQSHYNVEAGQVEESSKERAAKENKGYDTMDKKSSSKDSKWVNNYVPYGDYPKGGGGDDYVKDQEPGNNGVVAITDYDEIDFKEAKVQDDDDDEPEDSNKQEDEKEKEKL